MVSNTGVIACLTGETWDLNLVVIYTLLNEAGHKLFTGSTDLTLVYTGWGGEMGLE